MTLDELKTIAEARTKGEWFTDTESNAFGIRVDNPYRNICDAPPWGPDETADANMNFIAMAANNFDKLIKVAEAAKIAVNDVELDLADVSSKLSNLHLAIRTLEDVSESNETTIIPNKIP